MSSDTVEKTGAANQAVFSDALLEAARKDKNIMVVTSDSRGSGKLVAFGKALPDQIVEVGIAEQNLVGVAAGLAAAGKRVFAVSPACFLTARSLEQIKNDVCYSDHPVVLVGISAGVSYGALGSTHHSLHDFAVLRAINNISIMAPADNFEAAEAVRLGLTSAEPFYVRFGKRPVDGLTGTSRPPLEKGKAYMVRDGKDVALIANGETVQKALSAAELLSAKGISSRVLSVPFIRPLDEAAILAAASDCKALITVEEHSGHGGLGEACASLLMRNRIMLPFAIAAIPDEYTVTGSGEEILQHYGISGNGLAQTAQKLLST